MKSRVIQFGVIVALLAVGVVVAAHQWKRVSPLDASSSPRERRKMVRKSRGEPLNAYLLKVAEEYPTDGSYAQLPSSLFGSSPGVTQDLYYLGSKVLDGDPQKRSYCIGLIFETYMKACERFAHSVSPGSLYEIPGVDSRLFSSFRSSFYGADGNRRTLVAALVSRGLGEEILDWKDARPGDLVQFWRNSGNGHCVLFQRWDTDGSSRPMRLIYWSVQSSTEGIGQAAETIGAGARHIDPEQIHIVRAYVPHVVRLSRR